MLNEQQLSEIFFPFYSGEVKRVYDEKKNLAYYTNLATAHLMLKNRELWLRNVMCMNDYMEVRQGLRVLGKYLIAETNLKNRLLYVLTNIGKDKIYWENVLKELLEDNEATYLLHTYIACFTEHENMNKAGNLNMFRAYGRKKGAAIILQSDVLFKSQLSVSRVLYCNEVDFEKYLNQFITNLEKNSDVLRCVDINIFENLFKQAILFAVLSIKDPAFKEENEWRIVYCDKLLKNDAFKDYFKLGIEIVNDLPQKVYKLNLDLKLNEFNMCSLINGIIIEKIPDCAVASKALSYDLEQCGCKTNIINISNIPTRNW